MRPARCLLSELDAAGHADALEIPLLLSSDVVAADIELNQRPHILDGVANSNNTHLNVPISIQMFPKVELYGQQAGLKDLSLSAVYAMFEEPAK